MALVAARIMMGPLHLRERIASKLHHRGKHDAPDQSGFPQPVSNGADAAAAAGAPSSTS
jgi:hypothetical protein